MWYVHRNKGSEYEEVGDDTFEPRVIPEAYYPGVVTTPVAPLGTTTVSFQNSSPADYVPEIKPEEITLNDPNLQLQ